MLEGVSPIITSNIDLSHFIPQQTVENEHPAALWDWPLRWSIGNSTPQMVFDSWFTAAKPGPQEQLVQACDWSPTDCNPKCPLYT